MPLILAGALMCVPFVIFLVLLMRSLGVAMALLITGVMISVPVGFALIDRLLDRLPRR
ncbi:MAG: hypothetical protein ACRDT8_00195 [Micromonosporaceae bacterium]